MFNIFRGKRKSCLWKKQGELDIGWVVYTSLWIAKCENTFIFHSHFIYVHVFFETNGIYFIAIIILWHFPYDILHYFFKVFIMDDTKHCVATHWLISLCLDDVLFESNVVFLTFVNSEYGELSSNIVGIINKNNFQVVIPQYVHAPKSEVFQSKKGAILYCNYNFFYT